MAGHILQVLIGERGARWPASTTVDAEHGPFSGSPFDSQHGARSSLALRYNCSTPHWPQLARRLHARWFAGSIAYRYNCKPKNTVPDFDPSEPEADLTSCPEDLVA